MAANSPARAAALYEVFIAACNLKAEEIDDSDGEFGMFAGNLFRGRIQARQAAGADPGATAETLLAWMKIRREHRRKSRFMPGFEAIVAGKRARAEPSFLDRARTQGLNPRGSTFATP